MLHIADIQHKKSLPGGTHVGMRWGSHGKTPDTSCSWMRMRLLNRTNLMWATWRLLLRTLVARPFFDFVIFLTSLSRLRSKAYIKVTAPQHTVTSPRTGVLEMTTSLCRLRYCLAVTAPGLKMPLMLGMPRLIMLQLDFSCGGQPRTARRRAGCQAMIGTKSLWPVKQHGKNSLQDGLVLTGQRTSLRIRTSWSSFYSRSWPSIFPKMDTPDVIPVYLRRLWQWLVIGEGYDDSSLVQRQRWNNGWWNRHGANGWDNPLLWPNLSNWWSCCVQWPDIVLTEPHRNSCKDRYAMIEIVGCKKDYISWRPCRSKMYTGSWNHYVLGKRVRQIGYKPLPQVRLLDGELAQDDQAAMTRWREHFAAMEGGYQVTTQDLWDAACNKKCPVPDMPADFRALPSIYELEHFFKQSKPGKARGHDELPGELLRHGAHRLAGCLWPLLTKLGVWCAEPLQWKGGKLAMAYKQKGQVDQCSSYRALLVSSSLGKAFHNVWRRRVMPYVHGQATPLQFTAQRKALVSQASHCARLFMNQAQYHGRSCFLIYLDIQAAYYQLIRQHAVNLTFADQDIYVFLRRMGVDPMHIEELAALLQQPSVLTDSGCPDQLHGVVSEIHDGTWWTLSNDHMVIQTSKGTRPGDGFADVLWSLCFSKYLQRINECLTSLEICRPLQWNGECGFASEQGTHQVDGGAIVWADDAVIAADHEDANKIVPMLQTAAAIVVDELYRLGMTPNMSPGKTEAMLMVRGRHSKNVKRFVHCHLKGQVPIVCTSDQVATIRVVPRYVHLGGVLTHDGRVAQEIKRRLAIAADNLAPYRTKVFRSKAIGLDKRLKIFRSTALPALTYNVGTWPMLSQGEHRKWCGGVLRLYKQVLNGLYTTKEQFHMKRERVLAITGLPDPAMLLSLQRCKQFGHYLQRECDYFWALAGQDQMWLHAVYHDLRQVYSQVDAFTTLPSLTEAGSEQQWQDIWRQQPAKIRGVLRRAEAHHAGQIKLHSDVTEFHAKVFEILAQMGLRHPRQQKHQQPSPHYCYICNRSWDTFRAWAMHAFKSHGRLSKYRRLQQGSRCEAGGTTFHTHARLCRHFRTATQCANTLAATQRWVEAGLVTGNAEADRLDFLNAMIPSIQTEGECIPQRNGWTMTLETRKALEMFSGMDWTTELPPNTDSLIHKLTQLPIHYDEIAEIVNAQKLYYERQGQAMVATERLDDVLQYLYDRAQQSSAAGIEQEENLHDGWIRDYKELFWCEEPSRPRPSVRYLYVLHLFSGAKRAGDIHSCVQEISAPPGKVLLPVSLDVVLDSQRGNLLDAANQAFWIRAALSGKIFAVVAGPPCETWSISRWRWLRDGTGPRPVRSTNCIWTTIWGIAILKLRELKQVSTGNRLLHFALVMMVAQAATGGMGFLEHPEEPDPQPEGLPPSIWKLPIVQILRRHSSFSLLHLKQGYYGAKSPKPTVIMVICEKSLRKDVHLCIHRGKTQKKLPPALRMEKTSAGYSTMPLKRYPVALCRAIATAISHGVQFAAPTGFENDGIDEVALHFKDAYEVTQDGGHDGQDFFCTEWTPCSALIECIDSTETRFCRSKEKKMFRVNHFNRARNTGFT